MPKSNKSANVVTLATTTAQCLSHVSKSIGTQGQGERNKQSCGLKKSLWNIFVGRDDSYLSVVCSSEENNQKVFHSSSSWKELRQKAPFVNCIRLPNIRSLNWTFCSFQFGKKWFKPDLFFISSLFINLILQQMIVKMIHLV